ncbi:MAG: hypothetical protein IRZ13_20575 [Acetobacteraceae bacterium]|nr:hypothetical protein [Acetobacteraceae bacterium]
MPAVDAARPDGNARGRDRSDWLRALRIYLAVIAVGNLVWESLHLPLYTIWWTGTVGENAFAVFHCTLGDLLIALSALTLSLVLAGGPHWPVTRFRRVAALTLAFGVAYTGFSEWLNVVVRTSWAYSELMPLVPMPGGFRVGVSPLLQWMFVPLLAFWRVRRNAGGHGPVARQGP